MFSAATDARLDALRNAAPNRWVALSQDETKVVGEGDTFDEAASAAEANGESDPVLVRIPEDWSSRVCASVR